MMERQQKTKEKISSLPGKLEHEILDVLWKKGAISGKDIFAEIKSGRDIALTTVLTVLDRLTKKGYVKKLKGGDVFIFAPNYTKEEFAAQVSSGVLKGIFEISASGACASFVDALGDADPAELDRLSMIIEEKKRALQHNLQSGRAKGK